MVNITNSTLKLQHIIKRKNKIVCAGAEIRIWAEENNGIIKSKAIPDKMKKVFEYYLVEEKKFK